MIQHPHDPTPDQKRAIRDVVTIQCCKDVLKTFMIHVNPDEFFKAGGDPTKLSVLLGKECQKACGKRKLWEFLFISILKISFQTHIAKHSRSILDIIVY